MNHTVTREELVNEPGALTAKHLICSQSTHGKSKMLQAIVDITANYTWFSVYHNGQKIITTGDLDLAIKNYNRLTI
jgi:hypothetical protein